MGLQPHGRFFPRRRPPFKPPLRKPFLAQHKPLPVIGQQFEGGAGASAKDVDGPIQGIVAQRLTTDGGEPIDAFAAVDRLQGEKDPTLGSELQPQRCSRNVCSRGTRAGAAS